MKIAMTARYLEYNESLDSLDMDTENCNNSYLS